MDNEDLIKLSTKISKFVVGFEGNVSKKSQDIITIKASGKKLSDISSNDFINYNFNLKQLNNFSLKGSMELDFHSLFLSYDDINYVCHTHPTNTLKILSSDKINEFANKRIFPDQVIFNGPKSCVIPYVQPGIKLKEIIKEKIENWVLLYNELPKLILLQNHGVITFGRSIDECIIKTEICEKSAEIFCGSQLLGEIKFLTENNIDELINDEKEKYRFKKL